VKTISSMDISELLASGLKRTGKSRLAIARETGISYQTLRNIFKRRHATNAATFLEFQLRYAEVRDVVDEYLDLKAQHNKASHAQFSPLKNMAQAVPQHRTGVQMAHKA
jgi:hypothetical protein